MKACVLRLMLAGLIALFSFSAGADMIEIITDQAPIQLGTDLTDQKTLWAIPGLLMVSV
jgi:hypothetical protein